MINRQRYFFKNLFLFSFLPLLLLSLTTFAADVSSAKDIQNLMLDWTGLERQKDALQNDWRQQQPTLQQQLYLLEQEQEELQSILENTASNQDDVEIQRLLLLEEQTEMEQQQLSLEQIMSETVVGIERLYPQLPPPMSESWEADMPKLNSDLLTSSERLQLIVEMLTKLDDFQQKITVNETILNAVDGTPYLVRQVYLGLSHGWYISADGTQAASGSVTGQGWSWQPSDEGDTISRFIAILDGKQTAELISIPIALFNN